MAIAITAVLAGTSIGADGSNQVDRERTLYDFDKPASARGWGTVNDTVMGGVSTGQCELTENGTLDFSGEISLENNGGFASLRTRTGSLDLSAYDEIVLRLRGDGNRYEISLQTDYWIMAGAYYFAFESKAGEWQEIRAPLSAFKPKSFGRPLRSAPPLNVADIRGFGFIISDKQEGPFKLEIDWVKAASDDGGVPSPELPASETKEQAAARLITKAINHGAPLYNDGRPEACAGIYETAAECIITLAADELDAGVVRTLRTGLTEAGKTTDPVERAWILRRALDASLRMLEPK